MGSLIERIEKSADPSRSVTFVVGGDEQVITWSELHRRARVAAVELQARSVKPGDHVAILSSTSVDVVVAMQAVWLAGAVVVVLPLPMRMASLGDFVEATKVRIAAAHCSDVLVAPQFSAFVTPGEGSLRHHNLAELMAAERSVDDLVRPTYSPDDLAILQFTSGSTSEPKGVMLPNHMIEANLDAMIEAVHIDLETEVLVSWLPLYHDMGLIGCCVLPMAEGMNLVLGSPQDFLGSPRSWMEWISRYSGTLTAGPNFSYVLASRGLRRADEDLDLSSLRLALNGAEPVDPACVRGFVEAGRPYGLRPGAAFPAFGMAELAIAGAFPEPMSGLQVDVVDSVALERDGEAKPVLSTDANAREMVKLGSAVPGLSFRVMDNAGVEVPERKVGELQIKGSSVTTGYYDRPEATAELFDGDWLKSGDLGYLVDGQLVLCGRTKDLIIVGGRNIYPQDIERPVGLLPGVRAGNVVAFSTVGRMGKEEIVIVAECRVEPTAELLSTVSDAALDAVGVPCRDVVFVEPSTLPKTSSGKLQRALAKQHYADDQLKRLPIAES